MGGSGAVGTGCPIPSHPFVIGVLCIYSKTEKLNKMDEFMLIFRHEDGSKIASPEQMQIWMKQTMDWIGGIAAQNKYVGGNGLIFDDSRVVRHNNVVTNGPFGNVFVGSTDLGPGRATGKSDSMALSRRQK
jgi:hypothetical protein